ncbi:MAG TPA: taurine dioxygenase [Candidatus Cybelea sp.]|jgi:taurine dioxygenase|nr:taurine dioxygenase [Candidatus Cybelea sp.]
MIGRGVRVKPLTPAIGAVVEGIDLSRTLDDEAVAEIASALDDRLVLFFEDQSLTPLQQRDFAARFGPLYTHPFYPGEGEAPEVMVLAHDATHRANSDRWHNDVTYLESPPLGAVLYSELIPPLGGDTLWANMYLAYETLSEPMREFIGGLRAVHSFAKNFTPERFAALGMEERRDGMYAAHPPVSHPVARTNPKTGCKALFVNQDFTSHVEGVSARESDAILRLLFEHMTQPEFQVRWRWSEGTVAFWDNRWTQHCALADYFPESRRMRRATILGERPV